MGAAPPACGPPARLRRAFRKEQAGACSGTSMQQRHHPTARGERQHLSTLCPAALRVAGQGRGWISAVP